MREQDLKNVSDDDLLRDLSDMLKTSRGAEADLVARIAEVDDRKLYRREGASSMFVYCTEVLHLSEQEATSVFRWAEPLAATQCSWTCCATAGFI